MAFELLKNKVKLEFTTNGNSKIKFHRFTVSTHVCDITKFVKAKTNAQFYLLQNTFYCFKMIFERNTCRAQYEIQLKIDKR